MNILCIKILLYNYMEARKLIISAQHDIGNCPSITLIATLKLKK
jgi:hypothetical protein